MKPYNIKDVLEDYSRELAKRIIIAQLDDKILVDGENYMDNVDKIVDSTMAEYLGIEEK